MNLFEDWRLLIKTRANALPGSQERERLDSIYFLLLPVIARISEAPINTDIHLAQQMLEEVKRDK